MKKTKLGFWKKPKKNNEQKALTAVGAFCISKNGDQMKKQYLYPQNMRTEAKLWFWGLKDIIILAVALTVSVVSWAKLGFLLPAALTLIYGFLSMRLDECSVLDYIKRAVRFFITTQQYFEWKEQRDGK